MSRKVNSLFVGASLVAASSFITASVIGSYYTQDGHGDHQHAGGPAMDEMMGKWMAYMTPSEHHTKMASHAGKWNVKTRMWMDPNAPPQEATNKVHIEPIMGGRFLLEKVEGEPGAMMPGVTFKGMNIVGYDNHKKMHTFSWIDNMGTGIMHGEGTANADGSVVTYMSEAPDMFNPGQMKPVKSIVKNVSNDKMIFEMHEVNESGEWWKSFEGVYTRADQDRGMKHKGHDKDRGHGMHR